MAGSGMDLARRCVSACVFVPAVIALAWLGGWALFALVATVVGRASWEFYHLSAAAGYRPRTALGVTLSLGYCLYLQLVGPRDLALGLMALALVVAVAFLPRGGAGYARDMAITLAGVVYVAGLGAAPLLIGGGDPALLRGVDPGRLLVLIFLSLWITDAAAFAAGHLWGRRKLVPTISPNKTLAGCVVGTAAGVLPVLLHDTVAGFGVLELTALLLVVSIGGQVGDIAESAIKRDLGVKDAPVIIPGHGGMLDRFDSYLFAFPLAYVYLVVLKNVTPMTSG